MFSSLRFLKFGKKDLVAACLIVICTIYAILQWYYMVPSGIMGREVISPYLVTMDEEGNCYISHDGKSEVLKVNQKDQITAWMTVNSHELYTFGQANDIAVDEEGNIFISDITWNASGLGMECESVLEFDSKGHYKSYPAYFDYSNLNDLTDLEGVPELVMRRNIYSLTHNQGDTFLALPAMSEEGESKVYIFQNQKNGQEGAEEGTFLPVYDELWERAEDIQDIAVVEAGWFYVVDKKGEIFLSKDGKVTSVYKTDESSYVLPYSMTVDERGTAYFTDICNGEIYQIKEKTVSKLYDQETLTKMTGFPMSETILQTIKAVKSGGTQYLTMTCADGAAVINLETGDCRVLSELSYLPAVQVMNVLRYIAVVLAVLIAFYYLLVLIKYLYVSGILEKKSISLALILGVGIASLFVMNNMMANFQDSFISEQINKLCMVAQIASIAYITGHPTGFNVFFPLNFALGALFAGLYLFSLRKRERE